MPGPLKPFKKILSVPTRTFERAANSTRSLAESLARSSADDLSGLRRDVARTYRALSQMNERLNPAVSIRRGARELEKAREKAKKQSSY